MRKTNYILAIIIMIISFIGCPDESGDDETTYAIGNIGPSGVGIVFYITDGGLHGLEAASGDQGSLIAWSDIVDVFGGTSTAIGTGTANTDAIIA